MHNSEEKRRYCKTLELSSTQKVIFTAGISQESQSSREDSAFISAFRVKKNARELEEISTLIIDDSSHQFKKGFYRMGLMNGVSYQNCLDVIVVGS